MKLKLLIFRPKDEECSTIMPEGNLSLSDQFITIIYSTNKSTMQFRRDLRTKVFLTSKVCISCVSLIDLEIEWAKISKFKDMTQEVASLMTIIINMSSKKLLSTSRPLRTSQIKWASTFLPSWSSLRIVSQIQINFKPKLSQNQRHPNGSNNFLKSLTK